MQGLCHVQQVFLAGEGILGRGRNGRWTKLQVGLLCETHSTYDRTIDGLASRPTLKRKNRSIYSTKFSRMECERGPIAIVYDATTYKGTPLLVCFIAGKNADQWLEKSTADLKAAILVNQNISLVP